MNCDILLFDLDGTLTDSGPGIMHAAQYALRGGGIEVADSSTLSFFVGPPLADIFLRYFPPQEVGAAIARFREYYHETGWLENAPYPGIETCLQALCAAGKTLYVATSKLETLAFQVLSHFGLDRYFAGIFGAPAVGNSGQAGEKIRRHQQPPSRVAPHGFRPASARKEQTRPSRRRSRPRSR